MRAAVVALILAGSGAAQAQPAPQRWNPAAPENRQVLPNFNFATVESVLTAIGARFERAGSAGRPALTVTFPNNRRAALIFGNCEAQGCKSLSIQSIWLRPGNVPADRLAQAVQRYNQRYAFARALMMGDGRPALHRYLTADFGFIRGNLAVNLLVFAEQAERFSREVIQPLQPAR